MTGSRKLYVKSFGCQMNVYDSQRMADTLAPEGYVETGSADDADLIILNTCHIREKAAEKVYSELGRMRRLKEAAKAEGRDVRIAVAGCVAQAEGEEIIRRAPAVDLVVGSQNYHRLPDLLARAARDGKAVDTEFPLDDKFDHLAAPSATATRARGVAAFVTVQEGCDKFCTFCVVPYTRGAEISRPVQKIVDEVARLVDAGVREITLIGQNVNAYHGEGPDRRTWSLARLSGTPRRCRDRAAALYHQPSARHERRSNRRASRFAGADAATSPSCTVRLRSYSRGHESPTHPRGLSRACCAAVRGAAGPGADVGLYRRLPRRD